MARRPLLFTVAVSIHVSGLPTSTSWSSLSVSLYCLAAVAAVVAAVTFLCGSSSSSGEEKKLLWKLGSNVSAKAHLIARKMSWNSRTASYREVSGCGGKEEDEEEVWRKAIIMGDRCRQLDFSGRISYDCEGNLVVPSSSSSPSHDGATKNNNSSCGNN